MGSQNLDSPHQTMKWERDPRGMPDGCVKGSRLPPPGQTLGPRKRHLPKAGHPGGPNCIPRVRSATNCGNQQEEGREGQAAELLAGGSGP